MTLMLAIDTTAGTSVSVLENGKVLAEIHHDSGMKHAELIGNSIKSVLAISGKRPSDLTCVAVGRGPALFTGLRVGIAAAIMFAQGLDLQLFGVISHDALALQLLSERAVSGREASVPILVTTDARRGEVYWAVYSGLNQHGLPERVAGPLVGPLETVRESVREQFGEVDEATGKVTATSIGRLADLQLAAGIAEQDVSAMYLRAPDATAPKPNQQFGKRVSG